MIVITGATGALNVATVDHLLERVSADEVRVTARDVGKAQRFAERGVDVRYGDYADPASLPGAFDGADQVLLVSSNDRSADTVSLHRAAMHAAVQAGVGRLLYTSHQGAAHDSPFAPARVHAATEQLLAASGLPWTSLRNGFYAHRLIPLVGPWWDTGRIVVPADGPVSRTAREDAAEAAALVLATDGAYDGPTTLTSGTAPTFHDIAAIATELSGRPVECVEVQAEDWVSAQVAVGQPEPGARFTLGIYQAARDGFFAGVDPLLEALLGRPPRTVRDLLTELAAQPAQPPA